MPDPAVYFVAPISIAFFAASIIFFGVLKSGCPALKFIKSTPLLFKSAALETISSVKDGLICSTLLANIVI